jgi:hypothetical protein
LALLLALLLGQSLRQAVRAGRTQTLPASAERRGKVFGVDCSELHELFRLGQINAIWLPYLYRNFSESQSQNFHFEWFCGGTID